MANTISTNVKLTIQKPLAEVFAAALTPAPFFVAKASGPLEKGKTVIWQFPEFPMEIPIAVKDVVPNTLVRFEWGPKPDAQTICEFAFGKPQDFNPEAKSAVESTTISITESGWPDDEKGREASRGNTMGWTHMACSLKAYLEHGVNLRNGAFLHMKF